MTNKAPAGGMVSAVNGQFYEGGEFMPDHGRSTKKIGRTYREWDGEKKRDVAADEITIAELCGGRPDALTAKASARLGLTRKQVDDLCYAWMMGTRVVKRVAYGLPDRAE